MRVSDACQINDFDHRYRFCVGASSVSDACQINDFDHGKTHVPATLIVSDACQINDFDHPSGSGHADNARFFAHFRIPGLT